MIGKYTLLSIDEAARRGEPWQLCYVRKIPSETYGDVEEVKYIKDKQEYIAYFTTNIDEVWGDDWNDSIEESSEPYCDPEDGIDEILIVPFAIPHAPLYTDDDERDNIYAHGGDVIDADWSWGGGNTRICPMYINRCRMPWLTICQYPAKKPGEYRGPSKMKVFCLSAGDNPSKVRDTLNNIDKYFNDNYGRK